jgi:signal transduction histidine kinase
MPMPVHLSLKLLDSLPAAACICDRNGFIHYYNARAVELWGREPRCGDGGERFSGAQRLFRLDGAPLPHDQCPMAETLGTGHPHRNGRIIIERPDGARVMVMLNVGPIHDGSGLVIGAVNIFQDVAQEEELRDQASRLRDADRRKDEFLAMLAHELRNPLSAISSAVQLIRNSRAPEHLEWSTEVIERQVKHLARLVDDLLDVSRIIRSKVQLCTEVVDIGPILSSAVDTVRPLIEERKHKLHVSFDCGMLRVKADPVRLEQVVVNLLTNGAKYTESGGSLWLNAEQDGADVVISVRDNGLGIPPEKIPEMFDLFVQGDRSAARSEGGLGIGLTLVKTLVEMHGGTVTASSDGPGQGSEFTVRIPAFHLSKPVDHDALLTLLGSN